MKTLFSIVLSFITCIGSVAQNTPEAEIRAAREHSNKAIVQHDIEAFAESLSSDFVMVRGSGVLVDSKEAYLELFKQDFANPKAINYRREPDKIEISTAAPLAAEHGHWVGLNPDGSIAYGGTYLAMWRHTDEGWKIRSELFVVLSCGKGEACKSYSSKSKAKD
jgi:ketosteroid isomerase-like protein